MTADSFISFTKTALYAVGGIAIIANIIRFILMEIRLHRRDQAPVETAPAVAYHKHPDMEPALAGRHSSWVYRITFHTDNGEILTLYLNGENYYSIQEGDHGLLTWQDQRFWKFIKED